MVTAMTPKTVSGARRRGISRYRLATRLCAHIQRELSVASPRATPSREVLAAYLDREDLEQLARQLNLFRPGEFVQPPAGPVPRKYARLNLPAQARRLTDAIVAGTLSRREQREELRRLRQALDACNEPAALHLLRLRVACFILRLERLERVRRRPR